MFQRFGSISFLFIGVCDAVADLCVDFVYVWVRWGRGAESVSFDNKSVSDFSEVDYHVRDVTFGEVVFYGGV